MDFNVLAIHWSTKESLNSEISLKDPDVVS
jgi:hypothetical protein